MKLEISRLEKLLLIIRFAEDTAIITKTQKELQRMVNRLTLEARMAW